ncbi:MAG: sulfatase, partial [Candidatus Hydrogenedens sp.]
SKKWDDNIYFPSEGMRLINDGKIHTYSFALRFSDKENPIFDTVDKVWVEIQGISDEKEVNLEKVNFVPYEKKHPRQLTIGSVCMDVLWNEKVIFTRKIEQGMKLIFYIGIYNPILGAYKKTSESQDWQTDGIAFSIHIVSDGSTDAIYHAEMRPQVTEEDRKWKRGVLSLDKYESKEVEFIFEMNPINNSIGDFGVWGNPMLVNTTIENNQKGPPFFIISCDTLRPDHLLPYGYYLPTSPNLDNFAKDAVVFENAYTTQTFTPVAHMSMLTGRFPEGHGLTRNTDVYPYVGTLPELMRDYGYTTAGFAGFLWWFIPSRGFARGMDLFSVPEEGREGNRRTVLEVCNETKDWIAHQQNQRIFVFMHNYDVHSKAYGNLIYDAGEEHFKMFSRGMVRPENGYIGCEDIPSLGLLLQYLATGDVYPTEEEIAYIHALYDDCVYKVDYALGDFFAFLKDIGLYDSAFIAVVSDHGESLGEHGLYGHDNVYEESMRNVTIIKFPNNKYAGLHVKDRVILEDLMPTILEILNQKEDVSLDGVSLLDIISKEKMTERLIFSSSLRGDMRALVKKQYKLLEDIPKGVKSLFDLQKNMAEYYDVSLEQPELFKDMSILLMQKFGLKKEGWWLCFSNPVSFWTGSVNIQCSVPILFSKIQGGVLRTKNERTTPMDLKADVFLPKSSIPAIIQIMPVEDKSELKIHIQNCWAISYPSSYHL